MGKIYFNGTELTETYGMEILGRGTYGAPARDIEQVHVPGRNGDLLFDNGGYLNYDLTYPECCIAEGFPVYGAALRNFLLSAPGYHKLYDSYDMRHYRLAEFRGPFLPDVHTARNNRSAVFDLNFNCRPFRYLQEVEYENIIFVIGSRKTQTVLPASADGEYTIRCVNSGSASRTFYVYKFGSTSAIGSATVAAGSEATIYISTDVSDVLYTDVTISTGGNIAIYSNGQLVYSISGTSSEQISKIYNPYVYTAMPLISIETSFAGSITVGEKTLSKPLRIYGVNVDSEIRMAYRGDGTLANSSISGEFPVLEPGLNEITVTTDGSSYASAERITPRFCTL